MQILKIPVKIIRKITKSKSKVKKIYTFEKDGLTLKTITAINLFDSKFTKDRLIYCIIIEI